MIWRLTYCNRKGVEARIDIIKGNRTPIEVVQGSGQPFTLAYKLDKNDKSGHIMTSSADIEIFETETFNIDDLKTSNETELKVEYFEENVLTWSGFILPDFFSREIGSPNIVRMTASDRLTALKGITLSDLPTKVSLRSLIELSLAQTGLSLGLVSQIQINQGSTNILDSEILSQRLTDTRGRSINCYDILMSIMVGTNSTIRQRAGQWQVYNKLEHELRTPTIFFDKVERGAIRTIQPVASSVGVYNEFGGNRLHPNNYDFSLGLANWTARNGFEAYIDNRVVSSFLGGTPIYQPDVTTSDYLVNFNNWITNETNLDTAPFLESNNIPIASTQSNTVEVEVDISAVMAEKLSSNTAISFLRYAIIATNGVDTYALTTNGLFEAYDPEKINEHSIILAGGQQPPLLLASPAYTNSSKRNGVLEVNNVNDFHINIRIYGSSFEQYVNVNFASVRFGNKTEIPKGNLYKTTQGSNYTKLHDVETVIFGDYIRKGLNGYFYDYPIDETSNLYLPNGTLSPPQWITAFDTTERPLLHHISRQKSSLFSVAHDILKANINVESFDPLAIFQDCKDGKYVVVSARFDFLRSEVDVELEQIAYDNTISKRDYIYSYFGEGEDSIKSIGGISGGGGGIGGGGGMTSEQLEMLTNLADWWRLDAENDAIYSLKSVYSLKGVSALGLGSEGGGGGGDFDRLDAWVDYNETKANWVLSALLGYDLHTRVNDLEASGGSGNIDIAITGSGNAVTGVSKSGNTLTFAKSSTFALSTHTHTIANITGLQGALDGKEPSFIKNTAFNKNFGTTAGTVAQGNHLHTGVYEPSFVKNTAFNKNFGTVAGTVMQGNDSRVHSHANKPILDQITQSNIDVLAKLSIVAGNIKVDTTLWSTGGISALGLGSGGGSGGGGVDMLQSWETYTSEKANFYVPASLLVPFRDDTLGRLTSLEVGVGGRNYFSINDFVADNKARGYSTIEVIQHEGNIAYRSTNITFNHLIPRYLQGKFEANTQYYLQFKINWESYTDVGAQYVIRVVYTDSTTSNLAATTSQTSRSMLTTSGKTIDYITTTRQFDGTVVIYNIQLEKGNKATDWRPAPEDQVTINTDQTITGVKTFDANIILGVNRYIQGTDNYTGIWNVDDLLWRFGSSKAGSVANIRSEKVGIGTDNPLYKLDVSGDGRFTGNVTAGDITPLATVSHNIGTSSLMYERAYIRNIDTQSGYNLNLNVGGAAIITIGAVSGNVGIGTTSAAYKLDVSGIGRFTSSLIAPKVDFGNGFTIEPSGTELVFKYNGVIKQRMLSTGTILATGGITALTT